MKHSNKRIAKIVDELTTYFLNLHATDITVHIENLVDHFKLTFAGNCKDLKSEDEIYRINRLLNTPQHAELEEYYWELTGDSDVDSELALVGMMTTKAEVDYQPNGMITITLYRNK